jgi:peptidoglycan-associated lipoprotein
MDTHVAQWYSTRKIAAICLLIFAAGGCQKKVSPAAPPPPSPAPASTPAPPPAPPESNPPAITQFEAEPTSIQRGQSSTLRWEVTGSAASVSIDRAVGVVEKTGTRRVSPGESGTYTLTATGAGGRVSALATINVTSAPPPPPNSSRPRGTLDERIASDLQDAFFDYGRSELRADTRDALGRDATVLKAILSDFPNSSIVIEGHCDDRGSAEYNLGLGDQRASFTVDFLARSGVPAERLRTISYGKERPQCIESDEACWQRNRRVHFSTAN